MPEFKDDTSQPSLFESPGEPDFDCSDSGTVLSSDVGILDEQPEHPTRDYSAWLQEQLEGSLASTSLNTSFPRSARHVEATGKAVADFEAAFCDMERGSVGEPGSNLRSSSIAEVGDLLGPNERDVAIHHEADVWQPVWQHRMATCKQKEDRSSSELELEGASAEDARSRTLPDAKDREVEYNSPDISWPLSWSDHSLASKKLQDDVTICWLIDSTATKIQETFKKVKRGMSGYVNGLKVSALPDTGASQNIMTLAYAQRNNLQIKPSRNAFMLGNGRSVMSIGKR